VAATNKDLEKEIKESRFREDLYYRLNVVHVHNPPLRERREDLPELIAAFVSEACARNGKRLLTLSPEALATMAAYDYPGNVRELRNLVERLAILCDGPSVSALELGQLLPQVRGVAVPTTLPGAAASPTPPLTEASPSGSRPFRDQVEDAEREIILRTLAFTRDNATEAARILDLERGHFYKKMKALGIKRG
jgi:DNA-binding NtrC family response regulator